MGFTCGIIGLPNVGKSTLFNAITSAGAEASNYPFCTIDPNVGIVFVPDRRLGFLEKVYRPAKTTPTTIEFVDIAGLVRGASRGEGLGNQFLGHIRNVDAIAHVVRCFDDPNVVHVDGSVDPARDIEVVEMELMLKDLETVERNLAEAQKKSKSSDKKSRAEVEFCLRVREHLLAGRLVRYFHVAGDDEVGWMKEFHLLTNKPVMYICNVHEHDIGSETPYMRVVREVAAREGASVVAVSAEVEEEIAELPEEERRGFLASLGLEESGLDRVIREGYSLLQLMTFFTANPKELHAWTVRRGTTAPEGAGVIHSDFQRGFIRAEVIRYDDLARLGTEQAVKDAGLLALEGKDYQIQDGDVIFFRFHVG